MSVLHCASRRGLCPNRQQIFLAFRALRRTMPKMCFTLRPRSRSRFGGYRIGARWSPNQPRRAEEWATSFTTQAACGAELASAEHGREADGAIENPARHPQFLRPGSRELDRTGRGRRRGAARRRGQRRDQRSSAGAPSDRRRRRGASRRTRKEGPGDEVTANYGARAWRSLQASAVTVPELKLRAPKILTPSGQDQRRGGRAPVRASASAVIPTHEIQPVVAVVLL